MRRVPRDRFISDCVFYVTMATRNGASMFHVSNAAQTVFDSLQYFRMTKEIELHGYVIMPDHIHVILRVIPPLLLPNWARRFKSYTTKFLGPAPIWQKGYWSEQVIYESFCREKLIYMHNNPVRIGLAQDPKASKWSSAGEYYEGHFTFIDPYMETGGTSNGTEPVA